MNHHPHLPSATHPDVPEIRVFAVCLHRIMPAKWPPSGVVYTLGLFFRDDDDFPRGGLGMVYGPPGSDAKWSDQQNSIDAYQCSITNFSPSPIIDVDVVLQYSSTSAFRQESGGLGGRGIDYTRSWLVQINRIESGKDNPFVFYVYNATDKFVGISLPDHITARQLGEAQKVTIPLYTFGSRVPARPIF